MYFTGAQSFGAEQMQHGNSVGGYVSNSQISSGSVNSLMDGLSAKGESDNLSEYVCLALKNNGTKDISNINVYTISPREDNRVKTMIAAVDAATITTKNGVNQFYFDKVDNRRMRPSFIQQFYNVKSSFAYAELELSSPESSGGVITLMGVDTLAAEKNLTIDETYQLVVDAFENNTDYTVTFVNKVVKSINSTIGTNEYGSEVDTVVKHLLIERNSIGQNTDAVTFSSTGSASLARSYTFGGGTDKSVSIGELKAGEYIGLWLKKDFMPADSSDTSRLFVDQLEKTETTSLFFDYTEVV